VDVDWDFFEPTIQELYTCDSESQFGVVINNLARSVIYCLIGQFHQPFRVRQKPLVVLSFLVLQTVLLVRIIDLSN